MNYIDELKEVIERLHKVTAKHVETVPVKEVFQGETMWDGEVEVFEITGRNDTDRVYAWSYSDDNDERHHVTVLHIPPATSPEAAVRTSILAEFKK